VMSPLTLEEVYEKAKQDRRKAMGDSDKVYMLARDKQTKALAELRKIHDKERAIINDSFNETIFPTLIAFHAAAKHLNEARDAFEASPEQVEYRARIKRTDRILLGLYASASVTLLFAEITLGKMLVLLTGTPWAQSVTLGLLVAVLVGGPLKIDLIHHRGALFPPQEGS